ncbi:hypothetical protein BKA58DRAFT_169431 [Alternaria rosae]|uniref:uncharacterized protein n=1 Tax=Alternaria rosae TaxID=1187941 RepID=UPI001E8CB82D|nr:uncharacterized protein BKA58DRAFT_169431 [Alternaria rosae]KAH6870009.1 hypothetical protein BKA58DRAFT_169431 [Alternaria rosae]
MFYCTTTAHQHQPAKAYAKRQPASIGSCALPTRSCRRLQRLAPRRCCTSTLRCSVDGRCNSQPTAVAVSCLVISAEQEGFHRVYRSIALPSFTRRWSMSSEWCRTRLHLGTSFPRFPDSLTNLRVFVYQAHSYRRACATTDPPHVAQSTWLQVNCAFSRSSDNAWRYQKTYASSSLWRIQQQ